MRLCRIKEKCLNTDLKCVNGWSSSVEESSKVQKCTALTTRLTRIKRKYTKYMRTIKWATINVAALPLEPPAAMAVLHIFDLVWIYIILSFYALHFFTSCMKIIYIFLLLSQSPFGVETELCQISKRLGNHWASSAEFLWSSSPCRSVVAESNGIVMTMTGSNSFCICAVHIWPKAAQNEWRDVWRLQVETYHNCHFLLVYMHAKSQSEIWHRSLAYLL